MDILHNFTYFNDRTIENDERRTIGSMQYPIIDATQPKVTPLIDIVFNRA